MLSGHDALRFDTLGLLDLGALGDLLSRPSTANRLSESSLALLFLSTFVFSADNSSRRTPHVQKNFTFALCSLHFFALRRFVDDYELGDISVSLFTVQLRSTRVHLHTFFLMLRCLLPTCEELVKWHSHKY